MAFELRHASGWVCERRGPSVGAVEAAVLVPACVCAWATAKEIWKRFGSGERAHSSAFAGKHLEPGVEQRLFVDGLSKTAAELRPDEDSAGPQDGRKGDGKVRREFLYFARICIAARNVLGAFAVYEASGSGRGVPCQRVGRRFQRRSANQDVHPDP